MHPVPHPSSAMRAEVGKTAFALVLFGCLYLFMLALAFALLLGCGWMAFSLLVNIRVNTLTIVLAAGLLLIGGMVFFFLIKFLFASKKDDVSAHTEIFDADHPELFALVHSIADAVGTRPPKRIFFTPEVNASVSFDNGFWSMFMPVRKNLTIGAGLVNALDRSEFTAVLAHEFGHFSQKSMKAGSFVYQANKVIYNLLFENSGYSETLSNLGGSHIVLHTAARVVVVVVQGVQWVLRQAYLGVNRQYSRLSRQMEFHADAVAASVAGSEALVQALRRIELASGAFDAVVEQYNNWISESAKGMDAFTQQRIVMGFIAQDFSLPLRAGLPLLDNADGLYVRRNRVAVKDQWASHPSREDREAALRALALEGPREEESAWSFFHDADAWKARLTDGMYTTVNFPSRSIIPIDNAEFEARYRASRQSFALPEEFGGYYDGRPIPMVDITEALTSLDPIPALASVQPYFSGKNELSTQLRATAEDISLLDAIAAKGSTVRTFDFDGRKYKRRKAAEIKTMLEEEQKRLEETMLDRDRQIFRAYALSAGDRGQQLGGAYRDAQAFEKIHEENGAFCTTMFAVIQPLISGRQYSVDGAVQLGKQLKESIALLPARMARLRADLSSHPWIADEPFPKELSEAASRRWRFFTGTAFAQEDLDAYVAAIRHFNEWSGATRFSTLKAVLQLQAGQRGLGKLAQSGAPQMQSTVG